MKTRIFALTIALLSTILIALLYIESLKSEPVACTMDAMVCPDGSSVGRTGPHCAFAPCPTTPEKIIEQIPQQTSLSYKDLIVIDSPFSDASISSPVTITGKARGPWFFEGSFPISVVNWDGLIIGEGVATAQGEWMTEDFVPFTATITYNIATNTPYNRGAIILKKDNPSGLPENDDAVEMPVLFSEISE
jgi:hypothetical protein